MKYGSEITGFEIECGNKVVMHIHGSGRALLELKDTVKAAMMARPVGVDAVGVKDNIKLPNTMGIPGGVLPEGCDIARLVKCVEEYAREAVRLNVSYAAASQARGWQGVCEALNRVCGEEWIDGPGAGMECAVAAIEALAAKARQAEQPKPQEPKPFDLEAAKRGEALVTRDGRKAVFVAHDAGAYDRYQVLARISADGYSSTFFPDGSVYQKIESEADLFMAPKPKRTV